MNTKRKWYELLLPVLAVLLVLAVGAVQTARAGYVEDTDSDDTDKSSTIDETESTYIRKLQTLATANEGATSCHASFVENYVWTKGAYKQLDGYAESWVLKDWTWDPPPETPKGGNLTWSYSAEGKPLVAGQNIIPNPETQSALSIAGADSDTWATLTSSGPAYVFADAWGIVEDDDASDGDWDISDDPTATIS